jgi:flagellar biosynthetic protein FliR
VELQLSTSWLVALLLASARAGAFLAVAPPFNSRAVPTVAKALLTVTLSLPVVPALVDNVPAISGGHLILALIEQIVVGSALGFLTSFVFAAVQSAGSLIDVFGGFAVAFAFDPFAMTGNSVFGRFYNILATALFFATDAHTMVLRGFTMSFRSLPLDGTLSLETLSRLVTGGLTELFLAAIQIAGPLIAVLFLTDVGLGLLTRAAPALNVFSLGFPVKILMVLVISGTVMVLLPNAFSVLVDRAVEAMLTAAGQT